MIFTELKLNNLFGFSDTEIDFTYKRKPSYSSIEFEHLAKRPNFKFKRVCLISGANACGKTSLGKVMCGIQNFLNSHELLPNLLINSICNKDKLASFEVKFATTDNIPYEPSHIYHELFVEFSFEKKLQNIIYKSIPIGLNDSNVTVQNKLNSFVAGESNPRNAIFINSYEGDRISKLETFLKINFHGLVWNYLFTESESNNRSSTLFNIDSPKINSYCDILKRILRSFDSSIADVYPLKTGKSSKKEHNTNGFSVTFSNGDQSLIDLNGEVTNANRLSKGTFDAIKVAYFYLWMYRNNGQGIYFLDEKLSFSHSELEMAMLNALIQKLGKNSQFFYTSHNIEITDMPVPIHSHLFLKKHGNNVIAVNPEKYFNKNDRRFSNYLKNDIFKIAPNTMLIDELSFLE